MNRALITGAAGFIGQHLYRYLAENGIDVYGLDQRPPPPGWDQRWFTVNLSNLANLKEVLIHIKPDYVFHLAALLDSSSLAKLLHVNVIGTENLLTAIRAECPRAHVLIAGSAAEYGTVQAQDLPISEDCLLRPLSPYGLSKVGQSLLARQYGLRYDMAIVRSRTFNLLGPGEPPALVSSAIARQIALIEAGHHLSEVEVGNLETVRDFVDVRDAVQAYWLLVQTGQPGKVYNVCSGQGVRIRDLLDNLLALAPMSIEIKQVQDRFTAWDVPTHFGDPTRLKNLTGFEPSYSLQDSLSALLNYWREMVKSEGT